MTVLPTTASGKANLRRSSSNCNAPGPGRCTVLDAMATTCNRTEIPMSETQKPDPMDEYLRKSAEGKTGIFRDHSCWKCRDGARPCVNGSPSRCNFPHARND